VSSCEPSSFDLEGSGLALFHEAISALTTVLKSDICGVIAVDERGIGIIPIPGTDRELIELLASTDWENMRRVAREYLA
jgi:hypothetical protein